MYPLTNPISSTTSTSKRIFLKTKQNAKQRLCYRLIPGKRRRGTQRNLIQGNKGIMQIKASKE
ncbi:hypothetical protein CJ030_MR3G014565 [Morella rubra]|uniref:Uncharacterized protein n=1 Tax=Morella rubra TaxID=262757 RepID=A0A6A1VYZ1_9ROSI|nr:hypothetical protein CJ030_MR3G014565 [Morella rubra]